MKSVKEKKERALGERLGIKGDRCSSHKCALVRRPYRPGAHGNQRGRRRRTLSDFGRQLKEKQKFKIAYGISERTLRRIFALAQRSGASTADRLVELLERRLDNVVFRLGFAPSRRFAHQLVTHGHILVNGKRVRAGGYVVAKGDVISFHESAKKKQFFAELPNRLRNYAPPEWLALDPEGMSGRVQELPTAVPPPFEVSAVVESFSK